MEERNNFGDVVLYRGNSLDSRVIRLFTNSPYNHSALRINDNIVKSVTRNGTRYYKLSDPAPHHEKYLILRHKDITPKHINLMKNLEERIENDYSISSVVKQGINYLLNKPRNKSIEGLTCSSIIATLYYLVDLPILEDVHYSQIEPYDFARSPYFLYIDAWKRGRPKSLVDEGFLIVPSEKEGTKWIECKKCGTIHGDARHD